MQSFIDLMALHHELDEMFFVYQSRLLHFDFSGAILKLDCYTKALFKHMRDEEEILFPAYAQRAMVNEGGATRLFLNEHEKMRWMVEAFNEETARLASETNPEAKLIHLLDRQAFYKRLCSHHDKRERDHLYPELDRILTVEERSAILNSVTRTFAIAGAASG